MTGLPLEPSDSPEALEAEIKARLAARDAFQVEIDKFQQAIGGVPILVSIMIPVGRSHTFATFQGGGDFSVAMEEWSVRRAREAGRVPLEAALALLSNKAMLMCSVPQAIENYNRFRRVELEGMHKRGSIT